MIDSLEQKPHKDDENSVSLSLKIYREKIEDIKFSKLSFGDIPKNCKSK